MGEAELANEPGQARETIRALQDELALTNQGVLALTVEWEERLDRYAAELRETREEVQRTNSELLQLAVELEDRVTQRTEELKLNEDRLQETNQILGAIIHSSPLALDAVDREGRVILWSPSAERLFGWKEVEVIGKILPIVPDHLVGDFHRQIVDGFQGLIRTGVETQRQRKDGSLVEVSQSTAPLLNAQGQITGVMAILADITERKRIQAELTEVQRRLLTGIETERRLLAQDLHDGPMQDLYAISFALRGLPAGYVEKKDGSILDESYDNLIAVINRLREICGELRPQALSHFGLTKTILAHVEKFREKYPQIQVELDLEEEDGQLSEARSLGLFRIYQQGMINVVRHAEAKRVWVRFALENRTWVLEVRDDGKGFDVPARWVEMVREGHLGLVGASERAASLGGRFEIVSAPEKGTLLRAILPGQ